ncbi:multidrug resistance-associated protein 3, variant [Capsaspora owczarzaki ATCC 30864]|nr:multidrug resistance-associated protein 3, variant [Capsaspora owczarzaki ATCC 30864]
MLTPVAFVLVIGLLRWYYLVRCFPRTDELSISWVYRSQLLVSFALIIVTLVEMIKVAHEVRIGDPAVQADYHLFYVICMFLGQLIVPFVLWNERNHGQHMSSTISIFWLCSVAAGAVKFRTLVLIADTADHFRLVSFFVYYAFMLLAVITTVLPERESEYSSIDEDANACPEAKASLFSNLTFWWVNGLVRLGYKRDLQQEDLWSLNKQDHADVLADQFEHSWNIERNYKNPSMYRALGRAFGKTFFFAGLFKIAQDSLGFVSPQLLDSMILFIKDTNAPVWQGYAYGAGMFVTAILQSLILHQYFHRCMRSGMQIRSGLTAAVYRKALVLSNTSRQSATVGEIVNLMSVDSQRFQDLTTYLHILWSGPYQIALCLYFLYDAMGLSILAGVAVMILMIPINALIAVRMRGLQKVQMKNKDSRIKLMSEILAGIKVLKLYAWESPFMLMVKVVRDRELKVLKTTSYLNAFAAFAWTCTPFLVSLATFITYTTTGNDLTAEKAFVALALFNLLQFPLSMLPFLLSSVVEASVSNKRLIKFLMLDELKSSNVMRALPRDMDDTRMVPVDPHGTSSNNGAAGVSVARKVRVLVRNGQFKWTTESPEPVLRNIHFEAVDNTLTAVVGRVGCGKSSLVAALLGDMEKTGGDVYVTGSVAYVPQQPWIQNGTLRDNILFGQRYDPDRYARVIDACALKQDLDMLPGGDLTEIGEKGINLSGGQKQRVSIARAVYQNCDIYILDDPLSAVDAHVGKHIFDNVLGSRSILRDKVRILVTHSVRFLPQMDKIVVVRDGCITESGSYSRLKEDGQDFSRFLAEYAAEAEAESQRKHAADAEAGADEAKPGDAKAPDGKAVDAAPTKAAKTTEPAGNQLVAKEGMEAGSVKMSVYKDYMRANGFWLCAIICGMYIVGQALQVGSNLWLSHWSDSSDEDPVATSNDNPYYLGIYAALGIGNAITVFFATFVQALSSIHASEMMHQSMLYRVLRSPMAFFDTTPMGRIVNRFSKDVYILDETIPSSLRSFLGMIFRVASIVIVIAYSTPLFLAAVLPLAVLYVAIQRFYVATSRQLKRLDSVSRSPIYAHFSETLTGVSSIRAYSQRRRFMQDNSTKIDENQRAYYPSIASNRWLAIRLEFIGNLIVLLAALFAVLGRDSVNPGLVGLSISYALQVTQTLNWMVRMSSELETNIVAVERIKEYAEIDSEAERVVDTARPSIGWPDRGAISFKDYAVRYRPGLDLVLRGINAEIQPGEKIGICGRTGAGKTSLTLALFRLLEAAGGSIVIDGINISTIGLDDLRRNLNIIPQDPVLFSGTVRSNLDPLNQYEDSRLWEALERAHLKPAIQALDLRLDAPVNEGGDNFSVGQRQLMCLARALLRRTRILVLDEATSALDVESDALIQQAIRTEFSHCTVLTIAHRLNTILDSDRIMVLDAGRIVEFDTPAKLLANPSTVFFGMAKSEGVVASASL